VAAQNIVELFTSQGCGACPEANRFLGTLDARDDVLGLSFAVDYWDMLGWKDTFAEPANTARQRAYTQRLSNRRVYTPQMVVNGARNIPGGRQKQVLAAVDGGAPATPVAARLTEGGALELAVAPDTVVDYVITRIRFTAGTAVVPVKQGENRGEDVAVTNVVSAIGPAEPWDGTRRRLQPDDQHTAGEREAVLVQDGADGPIIAAFEWVLPG